MRLTEEGEIVAQYARRMAALYNRLQQDLASTEKRITKLRIGITHTAESNLTAEVLAKYSGQNTGFSITILTDTINNLYAMLENYEIDLAIVEGATNSHALRSLVLDTDFLVCVVSPDNPLSRRAMITLDEIRRERLILRLPSSATRILFESTLRSRNDSLDNYDVAIEVDNIATIKDLVRKNLGVSVLPKSACIKELRRHQLAALPIENLSMVRETRIVYGHDFAHQEVLQTITELYRETVNNYR